MNVKRKTNFTAVDRMCFMERVKNMIVYVVYSFAFRMASMSLDNYYSEVLGKIFTDVNGLQLLIVLSRTSLCCGQIY